MSTLMRERPRRDRKEPVGRLGAPGMDEWRRVQVPYGASWRQP